jgi:UDP-N-acetylglucosamine transferase subunit ALG13
LLDAVSAIAQTLPQPIVVQHGSTPIMNAHWIAVPFVELREFERLVQQADLLILHAGAGSVIHAVRAGKVPVVMPRRVQYGEHVDDHQMEFARALFEAGRVILVENAESLQAAVNAAIAKQRSGLVVGEQSAMVQLVAETLARYATLHG